VGKTRDAHLFQAAEKEVARKRKIFAPESKWKKGNLLKKGTLATQKVGTEVSEKAIREKLSETGKPICDERGVGDKKIWIKGKTRINPKEGRKSCQREKGALCPEGGVKKKCLKREVDAKGKGGMRGGRALRVKVLSYWQKGKRGRADQ